jgi:hypothetical protein
VVGSNSRLKESSTKATEEYARDHAEEIEAFFERLNAPGVRPAIHAAVDDIINQGFGEEAERGFREASREERKTHIYSDPNALWNAFTGGTHTPEEALLCD